MEKDVVTISIFTETIELQQFLKLSNLISSGGEAKSFILENDIFVNGLLEKRRKHKLVNNDLVEVNNQKFLVAKK